MLNPNPGSDESSSWSKVFDQLLLRQDLSTQQCRAVLAQVLVGDASPVQLAAFASLLAAKGEAPAELLGLARALLDAAVPLTVERQDTLVDTCGTGGDRSGTINVSTMAALLVAAAGVPVAKHGNRAASSQTGSADVLEALGARIDNGPEGVTHCLAETNFGFLLAPSFHPGFRHVAPIRRELGFRTAFNFLGPLINPARVRRQVVGVSDPTKAAMMLDVLRANGATHAMVVFGHDGLDELTTTTTSTVLEWNGAEVRTYDIDPHTFALAADRPEELRGGSPAENAARVTAVLGGERHAQGDIVALNAAAALVVGGRVSTLAEGVDLAMATLESGAALQTLTRFVAASNAH